MHNNIVVDHAHTAIDKVSGFDILNLTLRLLPKPPKKRLEPFFMDLKADQHFLLV